MTILLTGGSGQVGTALRRLSPGLVAPERGELDLSDTQAITDMVALRAWSAVINCAAYTAVDRAESDVVAAWQVNALAPAALAAATRDARIPLLHVSTDYVFDGAKSSPYVEDDPVAPLGVYGGSKEAGEQAVRTTHPRSIILRTAWVVSPDGGNFIKTILRLGAERPELRVVADQHGCPTSAHDIATTILSIVERLGRNEGPCGTYHFVNQGEATWHGLAQAVFDRAAAHGRSAAIVHPIATADYPTPARRPVNSRLSTDKIARDFGVTPRPWRTGVNEIVDTLLTETAAS